QRDHATSTAKRYTAGASHGARSATKVANANDPAACPLGKEKPPGEGPAIAAHHPSASQGRIRPTRGLISETTPLVSAVAANSHRVAARVERWNANGISAKRPQPPPIVVRTKKTVVHGRGVERATWRIASSQAFRAVSQVMVRTIEQFPRNRVSATLE